jgi:hypothetical protein
MKAQFAAHDFETDAWVIEISSAGARLIES